MSSAMAVITVVSAITISLSPWTRSQGRYQERMSSAVKSRA